MRPTALRPAALLSGIVSFLLLLAVGASPLAAELPPPAADSALAAHLEVLTDQGERLLAQLAHPAGSPQAQAELEELLAHLDRLQVETAALAPAAGAPLERQRHLLADHLRGRGPAAREVPRAALTGSGSISGVVSAAASPQPLSGLEVRVDRVGGGLANWATTDATGRYTVSGLEDGAYYVSTDFYPYYFSYFNETYDDLKCATWSPCQLGAATPIWISGGAAIDNIDFRLSQGGKLRGRVLDVDGLPIPEALVRVYDHLGVDVQQGTVDAAGRFVVDRLLAGTYYLVVSSPRHLDELYPGLPCEGSCAVINGTPLVVGFDSQILGLDFVLERRATLRGQVQNQGGAPVSYADVTVTNAAGTVYRQVTAGPGGFWEIGDLPAGAFFARARAYGYQSELFDNIACPANNCPLASGDPIVLVERGLVEGIDFSLDQLGLITGTVIAADTLAPLAVPVEVYNSQGYYIGSSYGADIRVDMLEPGNYFVVTRIFSGEYQNELWQNLPCPNSCTVTSGTPVAVALATATTGIDFELDRLGRLEGTVTTSSGAPLESANLTLYSPTGQYLRSTATDASGFYRFTGLGGGNYRLTASANEYRPELWNSLACPVSGCDPTLGQNIAVSLGQTTSAIDFALERLASIGGVIRDQTTQASLAGVRVEIYQADGYYYGSAYSDANGRYSAPGLLDGSYYAVAQTYGDSDYLWEIYSGIDCLICPAVTTGTPIAVALESSRGDVDFSLVRGGKIEGVVTEAGSGLPVIDSDIQVYDAAGQWVATGETGITGHYSVSRLDSGSYYVVSRPWEQRLATEVWPNFVCPADLPCNPQLGSPITVNRGAVSIANFALDPMGGLTGRVVDDETGEPVAGCSIYALHSNGSYATEAVSNAAGEYRLEGLDSDVYKVIARYHPSYLDRVLGGTTCEDIACDLGSGTPLPVVMGETVQAPELPLAFGPGIKGWVRREGSAAAGVGIDIWNADGLRMGLAISDATGRFRAILSSGNYFLTTDNGPHFVDEVWNDVACPNGPAYLGLCDPLSGSPAVVFIGQPASGDYLFDLESRTALFRDGFESGGLGAWSLVVGQ